MFSNSLDGNDGGGVEAVISGVDACSESTSEGHLDVVRTCAQNANGYIQ